MKIAVSGTTRSASSRAAQVRAQNTASSSATRSQSAPTSWTLRRSAAAPPNPSMTATCATSAKQNATTRPGITHSDEADRDQAGGGDDRRQQPAQPPEQQHPGFDPSGAATGQPVGHGDGQRARHQRDGEWRRRARTPASASTPSTQSVNRPAPSASAGDHPPAASGSRVAGGRWCRRRRCARRHRRAPAGGLGGARQLDHLRGRAGGQLGREHRRHDARLRERRRDEQQRADQQHRSRVGAVEPERLDEDVGQALVGRRYLGSEGFGSSATAMLVGCAQHISRGRRRASLAEPRAGGLRPLRVPRGSIRERMLKRDDVGSRVCVRALACGRRAGGAARARGHRRAPAPRPMRRCADRPRRRRRPPPAPRRRRRRPRPRRRRRSRDRAASRRRRRCRRRCSRRATRRSGRRRVARASRWPPAALRGRRDGRQLRCGRIRRRRHARGSDVLQRARYRRRPVRLRSPGVCVEAAGRHGNQNPVDRLAVDAFGVIRPGAWFRPDDVVMRCACCTGSAPSSAWASSATGEARFRARGS